MNIFYSTGGKFAEVAGLFFAEKHSPDAGPEAPDAVPVRLLYTMPGTARVRHRTQAEASGVLSPVSARFCKPLWV